MVLFGRKGLISLINLQISLLKFFEDAWKYSGLDFSRESVEVVKSNLREFVSVWCWWKVDIKEIFWIFNIISEIDCSNSWIDKLIDVEQWSYCWFDIQLLNKFSF